MKTMTLTIRTTLALVALGLLSPGPAIAADTEHPDWPCVQKKVENLAVSQMWDGPSIEGLDAWRDDEAISAAVKRLASRRHSIPDAEGMVKKFAEEQAEADRDKRLTLLFAGLFDTLAAERRSIMSGIEKYNKRQRERASVIEEKGKTIAELESKAGSDEAAQAELAKLQEDYDWEARIFKERNDNIPVACELPVLIDQRLFDLAKTIRGLMKA